MAYITKDRQYTFEMKEGILRITSEGKKQSLANQPLITSAIMSLLSDALALNSVGFDPKRIGVGDLLQFWTTEGTTRRIIICVTKVLKTVVHGVEVTGSSQPGITWTVSKDDGSLSTFQLAR